MANTDFPELWFPAKEANTCHSTPNPKEGENPGAILAKTRVLRGSLCIVLPFRSHLQERSVTKALGEFLRPPLRKLRSMMAKSRCFKIKTESKHPFLESWVILYILPDLHLTTHSSFRYYYYPQFIGCRLREEMAGRGTRMGPGPLDLEPPWVPVSTEGD